MSAVRSIGAGILGIMAAAVLACVGPLPASAETTGTAPWWTVTSGARPTNLQSGVATKEVQELTVSGTGGAFILFDEENEEAGFFTWNATPGEVQAGLEGMYGSKNVEVTGSVGAEGGTYTITFAGALAYRPIKPINAGLSSLTLKGARAEATVVEKSKGKADGQIVVRVQNRGDANANGATEPITILDKLPAGLEAVGIEGFAGEQDGGERYRGPLQCVLASLECNFKGVLPSYEGMEMRIAVVVKGDASSGEQNSATVTGGGAAEEANGGHPVEVDGTTRFGIEDLQMVPETADGSLDTQAGSHPFQLTTVITLDSKGADRYGRPTTAGMPKDLVTELPAGLVGNPTVFPQCSEKQFDTHPNAEAFDECPEDTAMGVAVVEFNEPLVLGFRTVLDPIFNLAPEPGEPARFGFVVGGVVPIVLDTSVRTGKDYGVTVTSSDITEISWLLGVKLSFWGVPGDPRHNAERGWQCMEEKEHGPCLPSTERAPAPFLGLPTSCEAPFQATAFGDSWASAEEPRQQAEPITYRLPVGLDGCNHLPFEPGISVVPDVPDGSTSTGLTVGVHLPQTATLNPNGLAESTLRNTTVALPEGVALNPSGADGLEACSEERIGFLGAGEAPGTDLFTSTMPEPFCPDASKIATVKIKTPLLPNPLEGAVYLATQNANPFGSLVAMYIVARDPVSGVLLKLPGVVRLDERTGRVVATFENTPELPFEDLEMHFFGGERAPLGTPALCGTYKTEAAFTPWSGNETAHPSSTFQVTSGPSEKPCSNPLPFKPELTAGTTSIQAGGFSPFTMTMSREDGNQNLKAIQLKMPLGMSGTLSSVKLCGEAQANAGTCGPESEIGETVVSVGLGSEPFSVRGGKVYITGPYKGAPFGLSIVNPAKAGPFDLGKVVVRAKIDVDPETAALTITTDNEGPYKIPTIIDGIPLQIKHVNVNINRPDFTFNATNCSPLKITGGLESAEGSTSALSVPYQVTNCAVLAFKPKLEAKTAGNWTRTGGTSLNVKLSYPAGPYDANITKVKVELPKGLPSRLPTLQKACVASVFEANPAACPPASIIGHARATTPVLPVPLEGPAYFVSHGGESWPSLIIVLQGYGVTVHLVGTTLISKQGVTSSTFKTVPDVPVGTFELNLPAGPFSALTGLGNLCKSKSLPMPTEFVGQNGAEIHTTTNIAVTGCGKAKTVKKKAHRRKRRAPKGRKKR